MASSPRLGRSRASSVVVAILVAALVVVAAAILLGARDAPGPTPGASANAAGASPGASATAAGSSGATASARPLSGAVLVGAGDIADCASDGDEATALLLDGLEGTVFTLGDNVYERGTAQEFQRCYDPTWGRQKSRTRPVPGNHEYLTSDAAGYFGYFGGSAGSADTGWYAYDAGSWRVYVLNSNCVEVGGCDAGSAQERWLRDDLAENPRRCTMAMWHHPRFSSGQHGNDASTQALWEALSEAGAELILNGHDHDYERFGPQSPAGAADPDRGIVEIVVGTGGRSHYPFAIIRDQSVVRDASTYGVLRLVLADGSWFSEFIPVAGGDFHDEAGGTCH